MTELPRAELDAVFGPGVEVEEARQPRRAAPAATAGLWWVSAPPEAAFLKVVHAGGNHPRWPSSLDPSDPWYWRREPLAYESGLLSLLGGGLRAPTLRASFE